MESNVTIAAPPRKVPFLVKIKIYFSGMLNQIGWGVFLFGILISWGFGVAEVFKSMYHFSGTLDYIDGLVVEVSDSGASENDIPVMQMDYVFSVEGREYKGRSYFTGEFYEKGSKVDVEYSFLNPEYSRIAGLRSTHFGPGIVFILIFPLIGLIILWVGFTIGRKTIGLLKKGKLVSGRVTQKGVSNISVNDVPLERLTLEYIADDRKKYTVNLNMADAQNLDVNSRHNLLYNPKAPKYARLLDSLPGGATITQSGQIALDSATSQFWIVLILILPVLTLYLLYVWLF